MLPGSVNRVLLHAAVSEMLTVRLSIDKTLFEMVSQVVIYHSAISSLYQTHSARSIAIL